MASITTNHRTGCKRILFVDKNGDRPPIYLGKVSDSLAKEMKARVEILNATAQANASLEPKMIDWLGKLSDSWYAKLARAGLVEPRQPLEPEPVVTLGGFIDSYIAGRTDAKKRTILNLEMFRDRLVKPRSPSRRKRKKPLTEPDARFSPDCDIATIKQSDADAWVIWLKANYAAATVGRSLKGARQLFKAACRAEIITRNPFEGLKAGSNPDKARQRVISREDIQRVLDACPDAEWRLLVALSRYGGLRCPSEHLALTWPDVDWERDRFWVRSPKTAHHEGKEGRWVPLFPELRPYLQEAWDLAAEGAVHVVTRYRDACANLRTQFTRIIRRAGLTPWPKLFHNLRASRETELAAVHPLHVVCAWIGNNAMIAQKHYLQVTEADFERAMVVAQKRAHFCPESSAPESADRSYPQVDPSAQNLSEAGVTSEISGNDAVEQYARQDSNLR